MIFTHKVFPSALGLLVLLVFFSGIAANAQNKLTGTVYDNKTNETLIGASVLVKGTTTGTVTDVDGNFSFDPKTPLPFTLEIGYIGYLTQQILISSYAEKVKVRLKTNEVNISQVEIVDNRISDKQKQAALTVESMDLMAIKEAPSGNFYESLGTLKGVDMTSASLGFKVINTRGFNSTSPVRSLQLIDGVDNQSPGLNFSLGNFLGCSDLDLLKVDIIAGASSAFYGPGAFNGVIDMSIKNPFIHKGLSAYVKFGERSLAEYAVRWAEVIKNKKGIENVAYKFNLYYMKANDWEANNLNAVDGSPVTINNPGGYDAVNKYGDEDLEGGNDFSNSVYERPGLGIFYRTGYLEKDIVDYNTKNLKTNFGLYVKPTETTELSYNFNFCTGTTVYQGDNRYSLNDVLFWQNKIEYKKQDKFFIKFYSTSEDAGNTYDAVVTAFRLQNGSKSTDAWNTNYKTYWVNQILPQYRNTEEYLDFNNLFPLPTAANLYDPNLDEQENAVVVANALLEWTPLYEDFVNNFIATNPDLFRYYHDLSRENADNSVNTGQVPFYKPGTPEFEKKKNEITSKKFTEGGSLFYDKSKLYNLHGEYKFNLGSFDFVTGASGRLYRPNSQGTIFQDTMQYTREVFLNPENNVNEIVFTDSNYVKIRNYEYGAYAGVEKKLFDQQLKLNFTTRVDKNQNFDYIPTLALSSVFNPNPDNTFRLTFSSAVRNPTLADQYLYYDVGRAYLLGNLTGFKSLVTINSFTEYRNTPTLNEGIAKLEYFNVDPIRPEKVKTVEIGYRGTLAKKIYIDGGYFYSWYKDFIGYNIGIDFDFDPSTGFPSKIQPYRVSANSTDIVTTQGFNFGINYYFKRYTATFNYSFNKLNISDANDPIVPAFNTPTHKFNIGLSGSDLTLFKLPNIGFGINYKWIEGYVFEGSPQFTGFLPTYDGVDAQINVKFPKAYMMLKIGASNLMGVAPFFDGRENAVKRAFDNKNLQVYGGPFVGRLAYISFIFDLPTK
jgi:iron complex outermembrane recepter protein